MSGNSASRLDLLPFSSPRRFSISSRNLSAPLISSERTSSEIFAPGGGTERTFSGMLSAGPSANELKTAVAANKEMRMRIIEERVETKAESDASQRATVLLFGLHNKHRVPLGSGRIDKQRVAAIQV